MRLQQLFINSLNDGSEPDSVNRKQSHYVYRYLPRVAIE